MIATVAALNIYPVKSCRGIALDRATLGEAGFEHDREWLVVQDRRFVTQREQPRLALIEPRLADGALQLTAPGMPELKIDASNAQEPVEVTCWKDRCDAFDAGDHVAEWLSKFLGQPYRLVRFDPRFRRQSNRAWTGDIEALNRFSDGYPWMLLSNASLADLNARLGRSLPMNRFRPNIVIDGVDAYAEDRMHELAADGVRLRVVKPCTRCIITTTDQGTAERDGAEPLRTLRSYRFSAELKGVLFGQNLVLVEGAGRELRVGDELAVIWK
jgi:uncharacterized protein YcbX